jgi:hypothetical protein
MEIPAIQKNARETGAAHYRLGLIYRNDSECARPNGTAESLDKAIFYSREGRKALSSMLEYALEAFDAGVRASEKFSDAEGWVAAKTNMGALLARKANAVGIDESVREFPRIRAIAELSAALETFPSVAFPAQYARTQHLRTCFVSTRWRLERIGNPP